MSVGLSRRLAREEINLGITSAGLSRELENLKKHCRGLENNFLKNLFFVNIYK